MYGGALSSSVLQGMSITFGTQSSPTSMSVAWGYKPTELTNTATIAHSVQYIKTSGFHHEAVIDNISCDTPLVYYQISADETTAAVNSFTRTPCSPTASYNLAIFGDMGYQDSVQRPMKLPLMQDEIKGLFKDWSAQFSYDTLMDWTNKNEVDMMWHLGDIGYIDDSYAHAPTSFTYEKDYDGYMNWIQNYTSSIPYMVTPGNHESECHSPSCVVQYYKNGRHLANFTAYNSRWNMPSKQSEGSREGTNMWYSLNVGPAHIVSINTETDFKGAAEEEKGDSGIPYMKVRAS